jgi:hypothetical protein
LALLSRVTRFGDFLLFGRLFPLSICFGILKSIPYSGLLFPRWKLCISVEQKWTGLHFGRFFHKLIWSPWYRIWDK